jgi:hypothetical protein
MAGPKKGKKRIEDPVEREPIPPGATQEASDRTSRPGGPPATPLDDRHALGTPGGGSEIGGLAGTNEGEGDPDDTEALEEAMAGDDLDDVSDDDATAYGGISGGAVGGTPAEGRSSGGRVHGGIRPGGTHRGDSTIGADPDKG